MVSVVIKMLTEVADKLINVIAVPIGYATELLAGIVQLAALPEPRYMCLPESANTIV